MQDPFGHCEQLVRAGDKDRFFASLFAPAQRRGPLFALYAFNLELARVREMAREPMAGEIRLQWWRDAIERPGAGEARTNPVAAALLDTIVRFQLPIPSFMRLIEARGFDLYDDPMPTLAALEAYAQSTSAAVIELAARILGAAEADVSGAIGEAGIAYALAGLLRAFPMHASRGQLYVPLDLIERHGARPEDIFAGRTTPAVSAALAALRQVAWKHFAAYREASAAIPTSAAPAFLPVTLVPLYLNKLERARDPLTRVVEVAPWRRQWALWRAARRL